MKSSFCTEYCRHSHFDSGAAEIAGKETETGIVAAVVASRWRRTAAQVEIQGRADEVRPQRRRDE